MKDLICYIFSALKLCSCSVFNELQFVPRLSLTLLVSLVSLSELTHFLADIIIQENWSGMCGFCLDLTSVSPGVVHSTLSSEPSLCLIILVLPLLFPF